MFKELLDGKLKSVVTIKLISGRIVKVKRDDQYEYEEKMFVIRRKKGNRILIPYTSIERIEEGATARENRGGLSKEKR